MASSLRPVIFGCAGPVLTEDERRFFADVRPCGLIVFRRNCETVDQLRALTGEFRRLIGDPLAPVFIDQEGGRVLRMKQPYWWHAPSAGVIGALADTDRAAARALAFDTGAAIGAQLAEVDINVNFAPCLDIRFPYTHDAIGDRAFHADPAIVTDLGRAYLEGMAVHGVQGTLKHMPGHGRALLDSHYDLPVIDADRAALDLDFAPFRALSATPWGILSHLLFPALDPDAPATLSAKIIREIIRDALGFHGLLVTDDISMKALKAPIEESSARALEAGCDIVCHCNGDMAEMAAIAGVCAAMDATLAGRFEAIRTPWRRPDAAANVALATSIDDRLRQARA